MAAFDAAAWAAARNLPASFTATANRHFLPLAAWLRDQHRAAGKPLVIGLSGAQGTGKTTLAHFLADSLEADGLQIARLSLDDLYLSQTARRALARDVHPLFVTRGVPGTHDAAAGITLLSALRGAGAGERIALPRFDKASDDPVPRERWPVVVGPPDIVLFEGWCLGCPPQPAAALARPVNALEERHDPDGRWRHYVNDCLRAGYAELWAGCDRLLFLQAPDLAAVHRWRRQQERELAARHRDDPGNVMSADALDRFLQHFERLTRWALDTLPELAQVHVRLDDEHGVERVTHR